MATPQTAVSRIPISRDRAFEVICAASRLVFDIDPSLADGVVHRLGPFVDIGADDDFLELPPSPTLTAAAYLDDRTALLDRRLLEMAKKLAAGQCAGAILD
ncbi:MAG TPA: hypothetical protein VGM32_01455, partial [Rhodopila sp.]